MKKKLLKISALIAFMGFCITNVKMVISQKGEVGSSLRLTDIESCEAGCEYKPWKNNGDCVSSSDSEYCDESWIFHDCAY